MRVTLHLLGLAYIELLANSKEKAVTLVSLPRCGVEGDGTVGCGESWRSGWGA